MKKTFVAFLLALASIFSFFTIPASAASSDFDWDDISSSNPIKFYAEQKITTYTSKTLKTRSGSIYSGDYVSILRVYDDEVARVEYPTSTGSKKAYISLAAIGFGESEDWESVTANKKIKVFKSSKLNTSFGTIYEDDICWVIDKAYGFVLYPIGKGYKAGFVKTEEMESLLGKKNNSCNNVAYDDIYHRRSYISQLDYPNDYIGTKSIADRGCLVTSLAMAIGSTPDKLVKELRFDNNLLYWSSLSSIGMSSKNYSCSYTDVFLEDLYEKLEDGPVIVGMTSSSGAEEHWILVYGYEGDGDLDASDFLIHDPSHRNRTTFEDFMKNGSRTNRTKIKRIVY